MFSMSLKYLNEIGYENNYEITKSKLYANITF